MTTTEKLFALITLSLPAVMMVWMAVVATHPAVTIVSVVLALTTVAIAIDIYRMGNR